MTLPRSSPASPITLRDLFFIFLKAGFAFGGGLGILAILEDELVSKRQAITREEFLATYALGRIVPSGTMTALAVAFGYRFGGWLGTVVALAALVLPALVSIVVLTAGYGLLVNSPAFELLPVTILPAALAFIVTAALKLGKEVFKPSFDLLLAVAAFAAATFLNFNPALLLLAGGALGILVFGRSRAKRAQGDSPEGGSPA